MSVHPSRAGLVPGAQDGNNSYRDRPRASDYNEERRDNRDDDQRDRRRDHGDRRDRNDERDSNRQRRSSPTYDNYNRDGINGSRGAADRDDEERQRREAWMRGDDLRRNGGGYSRRTPERELGRGDGGYRGGGGGGGYGRGPPRGGADFFEARRKERDNSTVTIWAQSPRSPQRSPSPEGRKSSRKHKSSRRRRDHSPDDSSDSDSDDDRRRRSSKKNKSSSSHRKKSSSHRDRDGDRHHSSKHRSSRHHSDDSESDRDDDRHRRHGSSSKRDQSRDRNVDNDKEELARRRDDRRSSRGKSESREVESSTAVVHKDVDRKHDDDDDDDEWVEKPTEAALDDADEVGPLPVNAQNAKMARGAYGGALLRGEGDAMAAYVQDGVRIPRRGEIGLASEQIERYEQAGYVMSGSRHRRMNAVRVRKENQVISAEEKRGILKLQAEEKAKRENEIVASFREMVSQKLSGPGSGSR
ncbi:hypothetical protein OIO90_001910 [Microbotryomycetes sp. JL221]|nr:hypothetical protein OIO90_001910 [Microbotryomycetes sp. JL221]